MRFCSRSKAIELMNGWGRDRVPFFFVISFDMETCYVERMDRIDAQELRFDFGGKRNYEGKRTPVPTRFRWQMSPMAYEAYKRGFDRVMQHIFRGDSFLTNYTSSTPIDTDLSLLQMFEYAKAPYKIWMKDRFVLFSPERFVQIEGRRISSCPMKGTLDATLPEAEKRLRSDLKEQAEHATIVDLIRNDLSRVADAVRVARYAYIDRLETNRGPILQMSSKITGQLPADFNRELGTLFFRLLPAGSITGAPKRKTVEIIHRAELSPRNFYTGVAGMWDGESLDSAVLIRFIEQSDRGKMVYRSGGGITHRSDPEKEYEEMIQKVYVPIY